jgi:hypothetical protein
MKNACFFLVIFAGAVLSAPVAPCQNTAEPATSNQEDLALLRQDVKSQKKQIVAANLELTDAEATKFWPIYDKYTADMSNISDKRLALVKEYADAYPNVTDAQAQSIVQRWLKTDEEVAQLREQYMPMLEKVLPGKKMARFFQIDRRLGILIDVQVTSQIPLVP